MTNGPSNVPLSIAKAKLSELVRNVGKTGNEVIVTVDGEPAARIVPVAPPPRPLTPSEVNTVRALMAGLTRISRATEPFDAVAVIAEGRR